MEKEIWFKEDVTDAEWQAHAEECRKEAKQAFANQQCSNDDDVWNFYSTAIGRQYEDQARLADKKGVDYFYRLVDSDGKVVDAKIVDGKYGKVWCVKQEDGSVKWVNVSVAQDPKREQAFYASKGYQIAKVYYRSFWNAGKAQVIPDAEPIEIVYIGEEEAA